MNEREISLTDLMAEVLLKWRMIIVWMLVGGILIGALSYIHSCQTSQNQAAQLEALNQQRQQAQNDEQAELEYLRSGLTTSQISNVDAVIGYTSMLNTTNSYLQKSIKMQIDPLNVPKALLTFQIVAEDEGTTQRIKQFYEDMVPAGLAHWLSTEAADGISETVLSELITLEQNPEKIQTVYNNIINSDTFRVSICHMSEEQCLQLAEKVNEYFQEQQSQMTSKVGEHKIQLVVQNFSYVIDTTLLENQKTHQNNMVQWNLNAAKLMDAFSAQEWQYYNYLTTNMQQSEEYNAPEITLITVSQPSFSMKYVLIGMILFAFLYAFYVFLKYILSARVRTTDDIPAIYGVPELGLIPLKGNGKKIFAFVDGWILKLLHWNQRRFTTEEAIGLAAVAVKMAARKENLNEVCCIGCNLKDDSITAAQTIQNILGDANISLTILNNILYDQEAMEQLSDMKGAFLLEKSGETLYDEINREIGLLHRQEIRILGIIIVE